MATVDEKRKSGRGKPPKPRNQKFCSHGLCKNAGKSYSTDADLKFIPFPKTCLAYRDEQIQKVLGNKIDSKRRHVTADCSQCSKALKWLNMCKRQDFKHLLDINSSRYVCSKHFIDPNGPTLEHPDPLPANLSPDAISLIRKRARKAPTCRDAIVHPPKRKRTMPNVAEQESNNEQCDLSVTNSPESTTVTDDVVKVKVSDSPQAVVVTVLLMDEDGLDANGHPNTAEVTAGVSSLSNATVIEEVVRDKQHVDVANEVYNVPEVTERVGNLPLNATVDEEVPVTQDADVGNETSKVAEVTERVTNLPLNTTVDEEVSVTPDAAVVNETSTMPQVTTCVGNLPLNAAAVVPTNIGNVTPAMTLNEGFVMNQPLIVSSSYSLNTMFLNAIAVNNKYSNLRSYACSFLDTVWSVALKSNALTLSMPGEKVGTNVTEVRVSIINDIWICNVYVYGKPIPVESPLHERCKRVCSLQSLDELMTELNRWKPCSGIVNDAKFSCIMHRDNGYICHFTGTIRSCKCKMFTRTAMCSQCTNYLYRMNARVATLKKQNGGGSKVCSNNRFLTRDQLLSKLNETKKEQVSLRKSLRLVKERCEALISDSDSCICKDLGKCYEDDDFGRIFIEEQMKASSRKSTKGYRWHPTMIKFALYIRRKFPEAYQTLRYVLCLPSPRTLCHYNKGRNGLGELDPRIPCEVIQRVANKENEASANNNYFALVIDEIKICEGLVYKKHTDEFLGFVGLEDSEDELTKVYDKHTKETGQQQSDATRMIQCTVKGITNNESFLYSYFPTDEHTVDKLYSIIREAIEKLELKGVRILAIVCDAHRVNREFMTLTSPDKDNPYYMNNPYSLDENRRIYFIPDAVHLLKAVRDSFSSSRCPTATQSGRRLLTRNGQRILWKYVEDIFSWDRTNYPRVLPWLTDAHVNLNSQSLTESKYAAQVLSNSIAAAIENQCGTLAAETVKFIRMFNKFFDVVNGREGELERNKELDPFTTADDGRLLWLEMEFTNYLNEWQTEVNNLPGDLSVAERGKMQLARPTIDSLRMIVKSVPSVIRYVLEKGVSSVPAGMLNHDPLDNFSSLLSEEL